LTNSAPLAFDASVKMDDTIEALKECVKSGKVKSWGLSNFSTKQIQRIMSYHADCPPSVLQDPINPYYPRNKDREQFGLAQQAWGVSGGWANGPLMDNPSLNAHPTITSLAAKYNTSPNAICFRWALAKGFVVLAATSSESHLASNLKISEIPISQEDVALLDLLSRSDRLDDKPLAWNFYPAFACEDFPWSKE